LPIPTATLKTLSTCRCGVHSPSRHFIKNISAI
jgi:hypothetical protein